jgi:3,4-dihydroxy 2-butanone 4-phosphate synthase/GTP cyclohydrolase II
MGIRMLSAVAPLAGPEPAPIATTAEIIAELGAGRMVVLLDDEDRENEGDLILAAEFVTPEAINFMARHARGLICLTLTGDRARQLGLAPMVAVNGSQHGTNFTVSIEAAEGIATGISAADRARTVRVAVAAGACAADIVQPGHIFPVVAQPGGVLVRAGHTEASCDLVQMAGRTPAAVICEVMNDDGTMARLPDLVAFAARHGLKLGTIADLIHHRAQTESLIERLGSRRVHTEAGEFELVAYRDKPSGSAHLALVHGTICAEREALVRVHEPLSLLDLLDPGHGRHSWTYAGAARAIAAADCGALVLLNCGESGQQLLAQFAGSGSADAAPGRAAGAARAARLDLRNYGIGAQILRDLGVGRMRLLARPRKTPSMTGFGLQITGYQPGEVA